MSTKLLNSPEFKNKVLEIVAGAKVSVPQQVTEGQRFLKLSDGWIRNLKQNLEFGPSHTKSVNYSQAEAHCKSVGGRLPTREELQGIVDYGKYNPAVDTSLFSDTKSDWYWTSSPVATVDGARWVVYFYYGYVNWFYENLNFYVRPVRPCQNG